MGVISDSKVDTTDVSSQGCGVILEGVEYGQNQSN